MLETDLPQSVKDNTVYLKDYQVPQFLIPKVSLEANLGEDRSLITATLTIKRNSQNVAQALVLNGEKLTLRSIKLNGRALSEQDYVLTDVSLTIPDVPDTFDLEVQTELQPHLNTELSGLYQSSGNFCTQCEAEGFRRITYFIDRPDLLSVYDVYIKADKRACPVLLSNGNLLSSGSDDNSHWVHWHDPHPKPSYLFALVAGDLKKVSDEFETVSGALVKLNIYTQAHNINKCQHAMDSLKASMRWDEETYGREYDLSVYNIVAVDDFNMGAMENKGLNVFNSKYVLADQQSATDTDYEGIESVIGHEYFHNWSGNRVTCRDWFQLSLKEGFTVFRDQEFSADMGSRSVKRIRDVQILRAYQFKEDAGPMSHPVRPDSYQEINNFYTATIYNKGAEVIRMMRALTGAEGFRKGTDLYFDTFDGQAVTTEDFVQSIEKANGIDLTQFRRWYTQSGTPEVRVEQRYNDGCLYLDFHQSCPPTPGQESKEPFQIPISVALFSSNGGKLSEDILILDEVEQCIEFTDLSDRPLVSFLRDFSAPVKLNVAYTDEELARLVAVDDNGFARWEAMQRLSLNLILPAIETGQLDEQAYQLLLTAMQALVVSNPDDKAVFAEMLTLPSAAYITELCSPIRPQRIERVRQECVARLARDMESSFHVIYANNNQRKEFSLSSIAVAERALKNRALHYLVATEQAAYHALASHQYHVANNMTDRLAAFSSLIMSEYPERAVLIGDFYQHWKSDTLVLDKWFALQAMTPKESALTVVKNLVNHSAFSISNPNKVRALIGAFSSNLLGFHREDGLGYEFFTDTVLELNTINPQVAARMVSVFNNWRMFCEPNKTLIKKQLERIKSIDNLAKDVTEIVTKALKD